MAPISTSYSAEFITLCKRLHNRSHLTVLNGKLAKQTVALLAELLRRTQDKIEQDWASLSNVIEGDDNWRWISEHDIDRAIAMAGNCWSTDPMKGLKLILIPYT